MELGGLGARRPRRTRCGAVLLHGLLALGAWIAASALPSGCVRLPPNLLYRVVVTPDPGLLDLEQYYLDPEDSTTVFAPAGFRLKVRHQTDQELNREYSRETFREPNLNPFTYGTDRDLDLGYTPPRFIVLQITAVNQAYPKVLVDPARMVLHTDRGEQLRYWDVRQRDAANSFEAYYMQRRGAGGNEEYYYQQRVGLVRDALYRRHTFLYQGESYSGKVVFAALHPDVREVTLAVSDIVLRVDAFDRPTETVEATFRFAVQQGVVTAPPAVSPEAAAGDTSLDR